ncbi:hypothetical protein [Sodalis-like endosymbiont of Proechinophthirus fluctus]|nr:hypothetical protein [Sodalis-like endosymbiont of Proechinophthirus fluctus]
MTGVTDSVEAMPGIAVLSNGICAVAGDRLQRERIVDYRHWT